MSDSEIKIYVANLAQYNNGNIVGDWFVLPISFTEISKKCHLNQNEEEWIILDYEAPFKIHEYDSIERLNTIAEELAGISNDHMKYLAELFDYGVFSDFEEAIERIDKVHVTGFTAWKDLAEFYTEEGGYLTGLPYFILGYIDYDGMGREFSLDPELIQMGDGMIVDVREV